MTPDGLLSVHNLRWTCSDRIILDVPDFSVRHNEVVALIGANGAGKSSLLKMLALLEKPDSGEIYFKHAPVTDRPLAIRRRMAMVFQEPLLLSGSVVQKRRPGAGFSRPAPICNCPTRSRSPERFWHRTFVQTQPETFVGR